MLAKDFNLGNQQRVVKRKTDNIGDWNEEIWKINRKKEKRQI